MVNKLKHHAWCILDDTAKEFFAVSEFQGFGFAALKFVDGRLAGVQINLLSALNVDSNQ